ncbi:hypothetical protein F5Y15DRAFT_107346 [Xylariaceae sp. FL0016]|nr:hypothetical protein F5Y15DRAFT_107346 [Xylariaceae sp. FL0016]
MATSSALSNSPSKENEFPMDAGNKPNYPASPTRSGTIGRGLSWQKRPNSQGGSRSRPLSMFAAENAARSSNPPSEPTSATESVSRDQIASALSSKDPSWFRQTTDRGASSAAYRRNQVEDQQTTDISTMRAQLPGMSGISTGDTSREALPPRPESPALRGTIRSPPKLDPPGNDVQPDMEAGQDSPVLMSPPPLGRTSPSRSERPASPTKGMGGFVQSAMMKRSDSVSKRWSVKSPGLQRTDSVASNRSSYDPSNRMSVNLTSRPNSRGRDPSAERPIPESGHAREDAKLDISVSREPQDGDVEMITPVSPSKTMDPRRWSPTKASWLESALNKPESPKPKPTPPPANQPAWMAEIQRAKAQKAANPSTERTRSPTVGHKHQVSIGGLMRSTAPGIAAKPAGSVALKSPPSSTTTEPRPAFNALRKQSQGSTTIDVEKANSEVLTDGQSTGLSPPASKPKPETPPKKDFRANLKPRQPPSSNAGSQQPEFKNVFGNLRKATTQNYVAPDELKDNILRGKAGLNITGGPKKTERKDEFKDAILAKKKEFQQTQSEGRGVTRTQSVSSDQPLPEGLAQRNRLGRSNTVKRESPTSESMGLDSKRLSTASPRDHVQEPASARSEHLGNFERRPSTAEILAPKPDRPSVSARRDSAQGAGISEQSTRPSPSNETSTSTRLPGKLGGSALANRFNPALAGLLARGPPGATSGSSSGPNSTSKSSSTSEANDNEAGSGPKLTHMTKGRARGPKRKAPTSAAPVPSAIVEEEQPAMTGVTPGELEPSVEKMRPQPEVISLVDSSKKTYETTPRPKPEPIHLVGSVRGSSGSPAPQTGNKIHEQVAAFAAQRRQPSPKKSVDETSDPKSQPPSPRKLDMKRMSQFVGEPPDGGGNKPGLEPEASKQPAGPIQAKSFDKPSGADLHEKPLPLSKPNRALPDPISLPTKQEVPADGFEPRSSTPGSQSGTVGARPLPTTPATTSRASLKEPRFSPRSLPTQEQKSPPLPSPLRSPTKQSMDTSDIFNDFFGSNRPQRKYRVDSAELLMNRPITTAPKIQTLSAQIFQFSADGKKQALPGHRERTLFEREMYLCSHSFNNEAGKKTNEVYFWIGDEVPQPTVEDASIFVSREARSMGGKLIKLQQGKETPEFLQALGGIVITQRGSGNKYDSLAPHMLCGRRYQGHVCFDEVDFNPSALCSGFPYLLTHTGRCYLWKGKGSGVDELSCARLIGMDYALSGEMEEIEDGREPATFWDLFSGSSKFGSADHWRLKTNYDKYCTRLFCSDAAAKQQIIEVYPFAQTDLLPTSIYVIDAFFELYIVVGSRAQAQYASFHNALDFAQEYAILAAGMEDRPFVPISTVVMEGAPRDLKSVFRKWRDTHSPTVMNQNNAGTGLKRGRSLKIVSLNQALQALSE